MKEKSMVKVAEEEQKAQAPSEAMALGVCIKALDEIDMVARARVVAYLHSKYLQETIDAAIKRGEIRPLPATEKK
jgi:ribonuclease HI